MIEVGRTSIVIRDVDENSDEYKKFERSFSFYNTVTHKYEYHTYVKIGKDIHCPAMITPEIVQTYFPNEVITRNFVGTPRSENINFNMIHSPKNDIQKEALQFLTSIKNDKNKRWRMLNLATGTGKTYVSILAISHLQQKALIVVDSIDLANQWKNQFLFHTDLTEKNICIISGLDSVEDAKENKDYKIYISVYNTLGMLLEKDVNSLNELNRKLKIGIRVFDESHVNFKFMCHINSLSNVNYTFFLTATPNRSDYREDILYSKIFKNVPSYNGHKDTNEKYHTIILIKFNSQPNMKQKLSVKTKYGFSAIKWANFLTKDKAFNLYISSLFKILTTFKLIDKKKKVAIMLPTIELINKTYTELKDKYPDLDIGKFIGEIKKDKRAEELDKQVILTNPKIFGKGIDVSDLDTVINYSQMSSKVNIEQILGRLRNNPGYSHVLIDLTDIGYPQCINQQKTRKRFYKKVASKIIDIKEIF